MALIKMTLADEHLKLMSPIGLTTKCFLVPRGVHRRYPRFGAFIWFNGES
jgi:hypothetical protein